MVGKLGQCGIPCVVCVGSIVVVNFVVRLRGKAEASVTCMVEPSVVCVRSILLPMW